MMSTEIEVKEGTAIELVTIPELPEITELADDDNIVVGEGVNAKKISGANLKALVQQSIIGTITTASQSPTGVEVTGQGYRVSNNTQNDMILDNFYSSYGPISAPVLSSLVANSTGGSLPASTTYYIVVTANANSGETISSQEMNVTTGSGSTNSITVSWETVLGATGYQVYIGTSSGTEKQYPTIVSDGNINNLVISSTSVNDKTPPTTNSTNIGIPLVIPASSSGVVTKLSNTYWAFSQDVFDKTGLVQTDELVTDVTIPPSPDKALSAAVIPQLTTKAEIINNVISTNTTQPLAASQGKALNDKIDSINDALNSKINSVSDLAQSAYIGVLYPDSSLPDNPDNHSIWASVSNIKTAPDPDDGSSDDTYINFIGADGNPVKVKASTSGKLAYNGTYWAYLQDSKISATAFTDDNSIFSI